MHLKTFPNDKLVIGMLTGDENKTQKLFNIIKENFMVYLPEEDSEDVTQEVLSDVWRKRDNIQNHPSSGAYVKKINECKLIDELRKKERDSKLICSLSPGSDKDGSTADDSSEISYEIESKDRIPTDILEHNELFALIKEIGERAETEALIDGWIALKYVAIYGLPYSEVAKKMCKPESTVKSLVSRFRAYLREELEKYGWDRNELNKAMGF